MQYQTITRSAVATAATVLGAAAAVAEEKPALDKAAIDKAFEALKTFDWGTDYMKNDKKRGQEVSRTARPD